MFSIATFVALIGIESAHFRYLREIPFFAIAIAVILVTWIAGKNVALIIVIPGVLLTDFLFVEPRYKISIFLPEHIYPAIISCIYLFAVIYLVSGMRKGYVRLEEEMKTRQKLEEQQKIFLAILGHDLRNPLAAIKMAAQVLQQKDSSQDAQEATRRITRVIDKLARLVEQLLDYSRCHITGHLPVVREPADMRNILNDVIRQVKMSTECAIECEFEGNLKGNWDPDRLEQMTQNLLVNALEHGERDKPIIVRAYEKEFNVVVNISNAVTERMAPEKLSKLFEPFGSSGRKKVGTRSTGLGLFIARHIALAHGGTINVTDNGDWIVFTVLLPCAQPSSGSQST